MLQKVGCLKGMSQSNQLSLFGWILKIIGILLRQKVFKTRLQPKGCALAFWILLSL
jgi:hypothetical protein